MDGVDFVDGAVSALAYFLFDEDPSVCPITPFNMSLKILYRRILQAHGKSLAGVKCVQTRRCRATGKQPPSARALRAR
jgi:hypothetical protein